MTPFENLNDHIVYTKVKSRNEATKLKEDAMEAVAGGKTVVIFFDNQYYLHLAPGTDPYQIRKEIEQYMANPVKDEESVTNDSSESVTTKTETTSTGSKTKKSFFKK